MRRLLPILLLLLGPLLPLPAAAQADAGLRVEPASGDLATRFRFEAPGALLGENLLRDPRFERLGLDWRSDGEVSPVEFSAADGRLLLRAGPAAAPGTAYAHQRVEPPPGWLDFQVRARTVEGEPARFLMLLREELAEGYRDVVIPAEPQEGWTRVSGGIEVTAATRGVIVYLRFELDAGGSAAVLFEAPLLRSSPRLEWRFDDGATAKGALVERAFERPGERVGTLLVDNRTFGRVVARVENALPRVELALTQRADGRWILDAGESRDPDARELLRNGDFQGTRAWRLDASEVGGNATQRVVEEEGRTGLRLDVRGNRSEGSAWTYQELRPPGVGPMEFRVLVRDDGRHGGYAIVLREQGPGGTRDHLLESPPRRNWTLLSTTWEPRPDATHLFVQLRFLVRPGENASASFAQASLTPAPTYLWLADGSEILRSRQAPWPSSLLGEHNVTLRVTDAAGGVASASARLRAPPTLDGTLLGPRLVRAGEAATWSAAALRLPALERLRNGGFEDGLWRWGFSAEEVGGGGRASAEPSRSGLVARLDYEALRNGTVYLHQEVTLTPGAGHDVAFLRRDTGVLEYGILVRETGFNQSARRAPQPWADTLFRLPSTPEWQAASIPWQPRYDDSTRATVYLRVFAKEGESATVWFDNASFSLTRTFQWTFDGAPRGAATRLELADVPAGDHVVQARVRAGGREGTASLPVHGLNGTFLLFPSLDGSVTARWSFPADAPVAGLRLTRGNVSWSLAGHEGSFDDPAPLEGNATYRLDALDATGAAAPLATARLRAGAFAEALFLDPPTRGHESRLRVRALHPDLVRLEARIDGDTVLLEQVAPGAWEGTWQPPRLRAGPAEVILVGEDAGGAHGEHLALEAPVAPFAGPDPTPWLLLVVAAAAGAWAAPYLREVVRRRRGI